MQIGRLARFVLFAALIAVSVLTYLREQQPRESIVPQQTPGVIVSPGAIASGERQSSGVPAGTGFDFYVLALSWSPSYCAAEGSNANRQQCSTSRPYGFVVHGLWPQYEQGYPQDCDTSQRDVPFSQAKQLSDIMPSTGLVTYEWRKHGSCTGLTQKDYFSVMRQAVSRVSIPSAYSQPTQRGPVNPQVVEQAFVAANPGMNGDAVSVTCDRDFLREVRVCLTKDLQFRSCPEVDRSSCRKRSVDMPGAR
ncbi:ribonuclease T2 family protein [Phyllobacterium myrsinacearum]|uniref:Ribonuclease T2 n=1 Tax=Phyllobacterium myrsinacearum TaxID=28101 RepID=A0A839E9D9_9HYPH|nr:ribonuclease [Phyllobacterium myrsinacearum]MBA8876491.1 ribonuclease T2 [Phyllobacterium myrsinacearum]